jgi:hypothetical protein
VSASNLHSIELVGWSKVSKWKMKAFNYILYVPRLPQLCAPYVHEISRFDCLSVQRLSLGPDNEQQDSMMAVADHGLMFENQQESGAGQGITEVSPQSYRYNAHTFLSFSIIPCIAHRPVRSSIDLFDPTSHSVGKKSNNAGGRAT